MDEILKSRFLSLYCMVMADGVVEAKELETLYRIGRENYHLTAEEINKNVVSAGTSFVAPDKMEDRLSILYEMAERQRNRCLPVTLSDWDSKKKMQRV